MPGYDRSRVVDSNDGILDEFICGICHEIVKNPVCTKCCGQTYCEECVNRWLNDHDTCPNDRNWLDASDLIPTPRLVKNFINKLKIKCDNFEKGCTEIVTIEELSEHVKNCKAGLCQLCEFSLDESYHNCIENLKLKITELRSEISTLKKRSVGRSTAKEFKEEAKSCNVNNYTIIQEINIDSDLREYLVNKCQAALRTYRGESVKVFAETLCIAIQEDLQDDQLGTWNVVVYLVNCGECLVTTKDYIQIMFDGTIIIEVFTPI